MKADEPRPPVVKYGMVASEQGKLVERHFAVMRDQQAISNFWFAHALALGPTLRAAFDRIGNWATEPAPLIPSNVERASDAPNDLRRSLGLD